MRQAYRSFIGENQMMAYLVMMAVRGNLNSIKAAPQSHCLKFRFFAKGREVVYLLSDITLLSGMTPKNR